MSLILSIETSTKTCSVALHRNGNLLACNELFQEQSHSGMLTSLIENTLQYCEVAFSDLEAIAVAKGPGSYTGLRIGTATAKGLCYALEIPLVAVNSLEAMALQLATYLPEKQILCPMIDARRMEVYCAILDKDLQFLIQTEAKIIDENAFAELLTTNKIIFFGDGAAKCKSKLSHQPNAFFVDNFTPSAVSVGKIGSKRLALGEIEEIAYFEPYYLKEFVKIKNI